MAIQYFDGIYVSASRKNRKNVLIHPITVSQFPAKEYAVKILPEYLDDIRNYLNRCEHGVYGTVTVTIANLELAKDPLIVHMIKEIITCALDSFVDYELVLNLPYFPYARQDRVCSAGESFSLKYFIQTLIFSKLFDKLIFNDAHSFELTNLLSVYDSTFTYVEKKQIECFKEHFKTFPLPTSTVVVAPDKGAEDKAKQIARFLNLPLVTLQKERKGTTLVSSWIDEDRTELGKIDFTSVLVVDDICDGGKTFLSALDTLQEHKTIRNAHLWVTHGLFTNGAKEQLLERYTTVQAFNDHTQGYEHMLRIGDIS